MVSYFVCKVLSECVVEFEMLGCDVSKFVGVVEGNYFCVIYIEVLEIIWQYIEDKDLLFNVQEDVQFVEWGDDFGVLYEMILGYYFDCLVMVEKYLVVIKVFYMQFDFEDFCVVLCDDMIVFEGYGEIIGGLECIYDYELFKLCIEEQGLLFEVFDWYFDLWWVGSMLYVGYGMGLECFIVWMIGIDYICEVIFFFWMLMCMKF